MGATDNDMGQAEFDLQRAMDLFDNALTSKDERVVNALRNLLMIVALTNPEDSDNRDDIGPLRAMERDLNNMNSRIRSLESDIRRIVDAISHTESIERKYSREFNPWSHTATDTYRWNPNHVYGPDIKNHSLYDYTVKFKGNI